MNTPPEDQSSPSATEILQIAQWIYHGAKSSLAERARLPLEDQLTSAQLEAVSRLRTRDAIIQKRSQTDAGIVADLRSVAPAITSDDLQDLAQLAPVITELILPHLHTAVPDARWFTSFAHLSHLDLNHGALSTDLVLSLRSLPSLTSLNLFGAELSENALASLDLPQLEALFLGDVTMKPATLNRIRARHPSTRVHGSFDLEATAAITQNARHNSTTFHPGEPIVFGEQISPLGIRHSFLICGKFTGIISEENEVLWRGPDHARDGMVLPNGNVLLSAANEAREYRHNSQEIVWSYRLDPRNKELGTVFRLPSGNTLVVERGEVPRLLEISPEGTAAVEVPLQPETDNAHMQTRMARKLPNGNYLVPHLLAFKVKEYTPTGEVVKVIATDLPELGGREDRNWPFTAIRLPNGNTLVNLTNGNKTVEFAPDGSVAWRIDNSDVDGRFADPCGAQRLPNGNTIICAYGQRNPEKIRIFEVTPDKKVVWDLIFPPTNAHEVHILTTNGTPVTPIYR